MLILALDCSQIQASVCLIDDDRLRGSISGSVNVSHSEALLPHIDNLLRQNGIELNEIDAYAVGVGPGSFTGIRIGCATIKGLAQATQRQVIAFSSLRALVLSEVNLPAVALVNAYQGMVFAGWEAETGWKEESLTVRQWCESYFESISRGRKVEFVGTGVKIFESDLRDIAQEKAILRTDVLYASPVGVARAVIENKKAASHYTDLMANYIRASQAELKLATTLAK